jgi:putative peptidoglycan lipid II flippase
MLVPVAVIGQAIATAALPFLTHLWQAGEKEQLDRTVTRTLQTGLTLALAAAAALVVLAEPLVALFYERGAWSAENTRTVSRLLAILALAVPAWIVQQIAVRPFYARGDTWRPMILGTLVVLAAIPLYRGLALAHGIVGLACAGVIGMSAEATTTLLVARRLHGAPAFADLGRAAIRALAIAVAAGAIGFATLRGIDALAPVDRSMIARLLRLFVPGSVLAVALLAGLMRFGDDGVRSLLRRRLRLRAGR